MLFVGLLVAALGAAMMTIATRQLAHANEDHYLPVIIGEFAVASPVSVTALRVRAHAVVVVATLIVLEATWDYTAPWPSIMATCATFVVPVAVPVIVITSGHNSRLPVSPRPTS
ncbi:hypothetical protein BH92_06145 [Rhodococcoides fascians A21d2]|uniref:hypothetical protein n=1 Tax=Rhodococcoides fascians TaxID=1828 RepID=UPI00056CF637|nr:hypothetical protein [Rhodococcus fascians]QIH99501.1 hypothetical protein BH92_06145 [Rhodococcus fascians A21d2]